MDQEIKSGLVAGVGARLQRVTPEGRDYFFGYYDLPAVSAVDGACLCHRVPFIDRRPGVGDEAEVGICERREGGWGDFQPLAVTRTWNFQQGSMLQWLGPDHRRVFWNDSDGGAGAEGVVYTVGDGSMRRLGRPLASVSRDGKWGLSIAFGRLHTFRPGYGYVGVADPCGAEAEPSADGVWLVDVATGGSELVLSLAAVGEFMRGYGYAGGAKLLVNHITFNPSGGRFLALVRYFNAEERPKWVTFAFTARRDGSDIRPLLTCGQVSHYWWDDDEQLTFWCDGPEGLQLYTVDSRGYPPSMAVINADFFRADGHCSVSPDGRYLLYDSYPKGEPYRRLYLYDRPAGSGVCVGIFEDLAVEDRELRCDLHPRWNPDGSGFTFDSGHEGFRGVYEIKLC